MPTNFCGGDIAKLPRQIDDWQTYFGDPRTGRGGRAGPRSGAVQWMRLNEEEISPEEGSQPPSRAFSDWAEVKFLRSYLKTEEKKCMRP